MTGNKELGNKLRLLRGERTMQEVADAIGVSLQAISMYENGRRRPSDEVKERIAKFYGASVERLFYAN